MLPFPEAAIEPAAPSPRPGDRGAAAPHIAEHAPAEIEDADLVGFDAETDPEDHLADDPGDDLEGDPGDDTDADASVGDPEMRYLPPVAAAKWLKSQGLDVDVAMLRRMVAGGQGPAVGHFVGRQGGWRVRYDQLTQWAEWERFRASWSARPRAAA